LVGWSVTREGVYKIPLRKLGVDEENLVDLVVDEFKKIARTQEITEENVMEIARNLLYSFCRLENILLDDEQESTILEWILSTGYGHYFFEYLMNDDSIEEITLIKPGVPIYVYITGKGWLRTNCIVNSESDIIDLVNKMSKETGRRITYKHPLLDAVLPDGSRLHASIKPISSGELTIRKFKSDPFTPSKIVRSGFTNNDVMSFLSLVMVADLNVVVMGNTASGKTTMLNTLFSFIPLDERIIIIEQTPEINIPHEHLVRLVANEDMDVSLKDLVYESLRMRPDRIVVGEVRNFGELDALFDVMLGGQARGAYATFHGRTPMDGLKRMASLGVNGDNLKAIDVIISQRRMLDIHLNETRKLVSLSIVDKSKDVLRDASAVVEIYSYDVRTNKISGKNLKYGINFLATALSTNREDIQNELAVRKNMLNKLSNKRLLFVDEFKQIQDTIIDGNQRSNIKTSSRKKNIKKFKVKSKRY